MYLSLEALQPKARSSTTPNRLNSRKPDEARNIDAKQLVLLLGIRRALRLSSFVGTGFTSSSLWWRSLTVSCFDTLVNLLSP